MKIFVTGNAGSGKTTVGKKIAAQMGMDLLGLDKIVWQEGWKKTSPEEVKEKILALIAREHWIIEGVSDEILKAADKVVFLDVPRSLCYWRTLKRNWRYLFSSRPELPKNCPEILIIPTLIKIIWRFPTELAPLPVAKQ